MTSEEEIRLDAAWDIIAKWTGQGADVNELHRMSCAECSLFNHHIETIFQAIRSDQAEVLEAVIEVLENPGEILEIKNPIIPWLKVFGHRARAFIPVLGKLIQEKGSHSKDDEQKLLALMERVRNFEFTEESFPVLRQQITDHTEAIERKKLGQTAEACLRKILKNT